MNVNWRWVAGISMALGFTWLISEIHQPEAKIPTKKPKKSSKRTKFKTLADKKRVFISFDFDNDHDIKELFVGQSKHLDTPFNIADHSLKQHLTGDWKAKIRPRITGSDVVLVLCGTKTHLSTGISAELQIAQEEEVPYFLLKGRADQKCTKPNGVTAKDKMHDWTWEDLGTLIHGRR